MTKVPLWVYWLGALFLYVVGEFASKAWASSQSAQTGLLAFTAYAISNLCWLGIMAHTNKLTLMSTLWEVGCIVLAALVGVLFYGETLTTKQWIGYVLALIAGYLLVEI